MYVGIFHSLIVPVTVYHVDIPDDTMSMRTMIDEQSDACFVTTIHVLQTLNVPSYPIEVKLLTVLGEEIIQCRKASGLIVKGTNESVEIPLPGCYFRHNIPAKESQIPRLDIITKWRHLSKLAGRLSSYDDTLRIELLIGINCVHATKPREVINGGKDEPYTVRTTLGSDVIGNTCTSHTGKTKDTCQFAYWTQVNEVSPAEVSKLFNCCFDAILGDKTLFQDK